MKPKYYVALDAFEGFVNPIIDQDFDNEVDANNYAALLSKAKKRKYIVLKMIMAYRDGGPINGKEE